MRRLCADLLILRNAPENHPDLLNPANSLRLTVLSFLACGIVGAIQNIASKSLTGEITISGNVGLSKLSPNYRAKLSYLDITTCGLE